MTDRAPQHLVPSQWASDPSRVGSSAPTGPKGLSIAALVAGIVALLTGWVPFVGLGIALVALVLGILAVLRTRPTAAEPASHGERR